MKILMVTRGLPFHGIGGMEVVAWDLAKAFVRIGHEVTILTTKAPDIIGRVQIDGIDILALDVAENKYSKKWWKLSEKVYLEEFSYSVDVVLSVSAAARHLAKLKTEKRPLFVLQAHGTSWGEFLSRISQRKFLLWIKSLKNILSFCQDLSYRNFDFIVSVGKKVHSYYNKYPSNLLIKGGNYLIENGIDEDVYRYSEEVRKYIRLKLNIPQDSLVFVTVARLHSQKGIEESLLLFNKINNKIENSYYILVGDGPEKENAINLIKEKDMVDKVIMTGVSDKKEVSEYLSASDYFIFLTQCEEVGITLNLLEAMASGLKLILNTKFSFLEDKTFVCILKNHKVDSVLESFLMRSIDKQRESLLEQENSILVTARKYEELFISGKK